MTNTTRPLGSFDETALPTGMTGDHIQGLMDAHGLTAKAAYALAWRDGNHGTNHEGGASMAAVFGAAVKSGGFGNTVTGALRKAGREAEVTSPPRGTGPRVVGFAEYVANYKRTMEAKRDALISAANDAADAVTNVDTETIVAAETERLDKAMAEIKATKAALTKDPSAFVASHTERLRHAADALATARDEGLTTINTELAEAGLA